MVAQNIVMEEEGEDEPLTVEGEDYSSEITEPMASHQRQASQDDDLETMLRAEMASQNIVVEEEEEDLLIVESEDYSSEVTEPMHRTSPSPSPISSPSDGPISLNKFAQLMASSKAQARPSDNSITATPRVSLARAGPSKTRKAVSHRPKSRANKVYDQDEMEPLRKPKGFVDQTKARMLPLNTTLSVRAGVGSSAIFNSHPRRTKARVRKERLDTYSRPKELLWMTDEEYKEHVRKERKAPSKAAKEAMRK